MYLFHFLLQFQDEVVAVKDLDSPKGRIVIRAEDFSSWLVEDLKWNWGLKACFDHKPSVKLTSSSNGIPLASLLSNSKLDFSEVENEKEKGLYGFKFFYSLAFFLSNTHRWDHTIKIEHRVHSKLFLDLHIAFCKSR
jgi:hypothetical protein